MARTAKTKHVLDLVGASPVKKKIPPQLQEVRQKQIIEPPPGKPQGIDDIEKTAEEEVKAEAEAAEISEAEETAAEPPKPKITVIVTELINQELWTVLDRFNLPPTDSNLWELTRTAIEAIRPEFSRNEEEYREKTERLRPRVINEMTKAAVKLSMGKRG